MTTSNNQSIADNKEVKLAILKKGILEERKKVQALQKEVLALKETIIEKDELIAKVKNEHQNLSEALSKQDPKSYYDNLFKSQERNQAEFLETKADNQRLQTQLESLILANSQMKEKLEEYTHNNTKHQLESTNKIEELTNQIEQYIRKEEEDQRKLKEMAQIFKKNDIQKTEYEEKIYSYEQNISYYKKSLDRLIEDNGTLSVQNSTLDTLVAHLKEEIERLTMSNYQFKQDLESMRIYPKNYVFKGKVIGSTRKYDLELTYGKYTNSLSIHPKGEKEKIILMNELIDVKKEKWNMIMICFMDNGTKKEMKCEFDENQIEYILKYAEELKVKNMKKKDQFLHFTLGTPFS